MRAARATAPGGSPVCSRELSVRPGIVAMRRSPRVNRDHPRSGTRPGGKDCATPARRLSRGRIERRGGVRAGETDCNLLHGHVLGDPRLVAACAGAPRKRTREPHPVEGTSEPSPSLRRVPSEAREPYAGGMPAPWRTYPGVHAGHPAPGSTASARDRWKGLRGRGARGRAPAGRAVPCGRGGQGGQAAAEREPGQGCNEPGASIPPLDGIGAVGGRR